jgi:glycosyltransferase involved in cell wall biosynthesis
LVTGFLGRGLEVDLVLARAEGPLLPSVPRGARTVDLAAGRTFGALFGLTDYLRRERPFGLIAAPAHANIIAAWAKLLARAPTRLVVTAHNTVSLAVRNSPKIQEKIYPLLLRIFHPAADAIVAVSHGVADDLARWAGIPRRRITVIHDPVVTGALDRLKAAPLAHRWFTPGGQPVVLAAGRLAAQKDFHTLLQAFAVLRRQRLARLVILGEGELRGELEAQVRGLGLVTDVDLPGFVDNPYAFMARCGVFVLSSRWEGFGVVLVEAMACGAQVVATDCPNGPAEILEHGRLGRLVPVADAPALAEAMAAAMDRPVPAESLRARALEFSVEAATGRYLQVLGLD